MTDTQGGVDLSKPAGAAQAGDPAAVLDTPSGFRPWMLFPVLGAVAMLSTFFVQLVAGDGDELASQLIDKPVPAFTLDPLFPGRQGLSDADLRAPGVKLVNVFASWCVPCRAEHPWLVALAKERGLTIHGINYKDDPAAAKAFLAELGDPYTLIGADRDARAGIELGVYGVPETFIIDGQGHVVHRMTGPITGRAMQERILPALEQAARRSGTSLSAE
ncbi:MAG: DsbE family thiol:disulfide interchange protein [Pseudomonadota bacterium]